MVITHYFKPTAVPVTIPFFHQSFLTSSPLFSLKPHINSDKSLFFSLRIHNQQLLTPTLYQRLFLLPLVTGIWDALTGGGNSGREAAIAVRQGMTLFREGDASGSLAEFDKAIELDPQQKAYLRKEQSTSVRCCTKSKSYGRVNMVLFM